jgi:hypothetical protein
LPAKAHSGSSIPYSERFQLQNWELVLAQNTSEHREEADWQRRRLFAESFTTEMIFMPLTPEDGMSPASG